MVNSGENWGKLGGGGFWILINFHINCLNFIYEIIYSNYSESKNEAGNSDFFALLFLLNLINIARIYQTT